MNSSAYALAMHPLGTGQSCARLDKGRESAMLLSLVSRGPAQSRKGKKAVMPHHWPLVHACQLLAQA